MPGPLRLSSNLCPCPRRLGAETPLFPTRRASIVQFSILTLFPLAILMVNLGGLALCSRMKRQLKESVSLVVVTNPGPAHDLAATPAGSSEADLAAPEGPLPAPSSPSPAPEARSTGEGTHIQKPRARLDGCELPYLARQRENGGGSAARAQARRILVLKKAMRDLQTVRSVPSRRARAQVNWTDPVSAHGRPRGTSPWSRHAWP